MRALAFLLGGSSIACLLAEFYGLCPMRLSVPLLLLPAAILAARLAPKGALAGLAAALAYDLLRIPWVASAALGAGPDWLQLPLFKVFPRFGAMILGIPFEPSWTDGQFPLPAHLVGWAYHFSNGAGFGIMYLALAGPRRHWLWAVAFAEVLELGMLVTPYAGFFGIRPGPAFVAATVAAHAVFGAVLGLWLARGSGAPPGPPAGARGA